MESAKKWVSAHPDIAKSIEEEDIIMGFDDLEEMVASLKSKLEAELEEQRKVYDTFIQKLIEDAVKSFAEKLVEKINEIIEAKKQEEVKEVLGEGKDKEIEKRNADEVLGILNAINDEIKKVFNVQS